MLFSCVFSFNEFKPKDFIMIYARHFSRQGNAFISQKNLFFLILLFQSVSLFCMAENPIEGLCSAVRNNDYERFELLFSTGHFTRRDLTRGDLKKAYCAITIDADSCPYLEQYICLGGKEDKICFTYTSVLYQCLTSNDMAKFLDLILKKYPSLVYYEFDFRNGLKISPLRVAIAFVALDAMSLLFFHLINCGYACVVGPIDDNMMLVLSDETIAQRRMNYPRGWLAVSEYFSFFMKEKDRCIDKENLCSVCVAEHKRISSNLKPDDFRPIIEVMYEKTQDVIEIEELYQRLVLEEKEKRLRMKRDLYC